MLLRGLVVAMLFLGGMCRSFGASAEVNAFNKAARHFSLENWEGAAHEFGVFITNHPTSFRVSEAILFRGEALIKASRPVEAIELLGASQSRAGELADLYLFWIAQAHLANTNFADAAAAFAQVVNHYPDSTNRLEALVGQAGALARLEKWNEVAALLGRQDGVFQRSAATVTNEWVTRGFLLFGEAELKSGRIESALEAVRALDRQALKPELAWERWHLQTRIELAAGRLEDARHSATNNLLALADAAGSARLRAESLLVMGSILEKLRLNDEAIAVYQQNLTNGVPVAVQRTALLKIARLSLGQPAKAVQRLEQFLSDYPQTAAADTVLLNIGELKLKQATAAAEVNTNLVLEAQTQFESLINRFRDSLLIGNAHLGRGWCLWYLRDYAGAQEAFRLAVERLSAPEDRAVAQFKLADAYFSGGNLEPALEAYRQLIANYAGKPQVGPELIEQALYQTVRTALAITNLPAAEEAVGQMLKWYPNGLRGESSLFLVAEGYVQRNNPAKARELLAEFERLFGSSTNALLPEVRLAISRSYEKEGNWTAAIANYDAWIATFKEDGRLPEAQFARAWDTAMSGATTNALERFQKFLTAHPNHPLAARARWWIGDYYFRLGDYGKAEENYPYTTNYAGERDLFYKAHLRAGAAAMARLSYKDAIAYFTTLIGDPKCPPELKIKAAIAAGDAYMARNEPGTTNRLADLEEAVAQFNFVLRSFPTNGLVPLALGRLGDCYKEMGSTNPRFYERSAEAYNKVIALTNATVGTRRQARIALGILAEAKAEGKTGAEQQTLQKEALAHYADAFVFEELQVNEPADIFWYQKAGVETARVAELLGNWNQALNIYRALQSVPDISPGFQTTLERRRAKALEQVNAASRREF